MEEVSPAREMGRRIGEWLRHPLHMLLSPHIYRVLEEIRDRLECERKCEDEAVPDCEQCSYHGHCPYEPQASYEPPPGYMLVRPGPPPHPWEIN